MSRLRRVHGRNLNEVLEGKRERRRERLLTSAFALLVAVAAILMVQHSQHSKRADLQRSRIVVVPFENRTGDTAFDALGLVASDWAARMLMLQGGRYQIVPTTTVLAYVHSARLARHDLLTRARLLSRGTRAGIVVWGSVYKAGDSLRFSVEVNDRQSGRMVGSVPQIATPVSEPMAGVDRLQAAIIAATERRAVARASRRLPQLHAYYDFVAGLRAYVQRDFQAAAHHFADAAGNDTSYLPHQVWLIDALYFDNQYERADSAAQQLDGRRVTRLEEARAMRALARLNRDPYDTYLYSAQLAAQNPADDFAAYELGLAALALRRAHEARRIFSELEPASGFLHGRPDYHLHHAAAYHLLGNHRAELQAVRKGLKLRHRALDVRLANCRVRAALRREPEAMAAARAITAADTDATNSEITIGAALEDCSAEMNAHQLPALADSVQRLAEKWHHRFPYPERGGMMLHAGSAFRSLRDARGFLLIDEPRG